MRKLEDVERERKQRKPGEWTPPVGNRPGGPTSVRQIQGIINAASLAGRAARRREWVVEGLIPCRAVTLLSGDGGLGKSLLALQLGCCCVLGRAWLGIETKNCNAVYVSCEDDREEMHIRLEPLAESEEWNIADLGGLTIIDRTCQDNAVMERDPAYGSPWEPTQFWIQLRNFVIDCEAKLLVLDSMYDFYPGNQLDQTSVRKFMGFLTELAYEADAAVLVLMHPSKSGVDSGDGASGSRAFRNAARSMLYLESGAIDGADEQDAPSVLKDKKANRGARGFELSIKWEAGRFVPTHNSASSRNSFLDHLGADGAFLACLEKAAEQHRFYSHQRGTTFAPAAFARMRQANGYKVSDLTKAMERLFADDKIEVGQVGVYSNRHPRYGLVKKGEKPISENDENAPQNNGTESDLFSESL